MWMITKSSFQLQFQIRNEHITGKVKGISSSHDGNSAKSVVSAGKGLCVHFLTNTFAPMILWEPQKVPAVERHIISGRVKGWIIQGRVHKYMQRCTNAYARGKSTAQLPHLIKVWTYNIQSKVLGGLQKGHGKCRLWEVRGKLCTGFKIIGAPK